MRISHATQINSIEETNGYGYATVNMISSLERLGYQVSKNDSSADVEIWFDQPHHWKWSKGTYRIGYHPWESTRLKDGWVEKMNECDEVWTPSPVIAKWYQEYAGVDVPVFVYEHGVDPIWKKKPRPVTDKFNFLHVGAEASRKGGVETMRAFRRAFPHNRDVELNLKIISKGWNIGRFNRINVINEKMSLDELIALYHNNHVYVYPSYGEGFGLTPLQAMATGMPTITVPAWAPYADFLDPKLSIDSHFIGSPWPTLHPGNMLKPKLDDIIDAMRYAYDNYDAVEAEAQERVSQITDYYDWDRLTKIAFDDLAHRLEK